MRTMTEEQQHRAAEAQAARQTIDRDNQQRLAAERVASKRQYACFSPRHRALLGDSAMKWPDQGAIIRSTLKAALAGRCVIILGERGVGKTQMLTQVGWDACAETAVGMVRMWEGAEIIDHISTKAFSERTPRATVIDQLCKMQSLMLIDDLHRRRHTPEEMLILGDLLNARYQMKAGTIIAANYTPDALAESLGADVMSRIGEWGEVFVLARWESRRPQVKVTLA